MNGFLLVNKPAGISSFGVVARVRRIIKEQTGHRVKVGHTGTLDPAATGLLILVIGSYTKRAAEFSKLDKTYEAEITLGNVSSTGDGEGTITKQSASKPPPKEVKGVLQAFIGEISQTPPAFSAIKVGGQRAYKLARAGKQVKIEPRQIRIYSIKNVQYKYPKLNFATEVSSGTYIRSLAVDIGEKLGTGAYLSALKRSQVGSFRLKQASHIDKISISDIISL